MNRLKIQQVLRLNDREYFRKKYLVPAIEMDLVEMAIPDKPNSSPHLGLDQECRQIGFVIGRPRTCRYDKPIVRILWLNL